MQSHVLLAILQEHIDAASVQCEMCEKSDYNFYNGQLQALLHARDDIKGLIHTENKIRHTKKLLKRESPNE